MPDLSEGDVVPELVEGSLPNGWVEKNLVSCLEKVIDYRGKTPKKSNSGILTLSAKSVKMGKIDYSKAYYILKETYDKFMVRGFPKKGDVLMTTEAPLGCIAKLDRDNISVAQRLLTLRGKEGVLDNDYLMFYLTSRRGQHELHSRASGSTVQGIKRSEFEYVKIVLPPLPEQKAIADMLSSFDEKIELLREQNNTLETLAQTIFKEWFVHFNYPDATGEMGDSELGEIPKGWRVGRLGDIGCNIRDGISADKIEPEMKYVALEHMPRKSIALDSWVSAGKVASNKFVFKKGSILFGKLRPYFHKVGVAVISGICSTDILVIEPKKEFQKAYLLMYLSSDEFIQYVTLASEGTRMPRTSWKYMKDYTVCLPPDDIVTSFNALINNIIDKIGNNIFQIQTLSKTRDTLLPKLMNGQVRVNISA